MNITYDRIAEVNKKINYTDVRGKNYAEVAQRVQAFRNLIPGGYITTEILKLENGIVYMKAEAGYYENGNRVMLATGLAFERQDASNINKTSFIENCETSAIGRALGFIGLGSEKSIASAEEVANAIATQEAIEAGAIEDPAKRTETPPAPPVNASVTKVPSVPPTAQNDPQKSENPVLDFISNERESLRVARRMTKAENNALFKRQTDILREAGLIPNKMFNMMTMQEAQTMVNLMYTKFTPTGTELLPDDGQTA